MIQLKNLHKTFKHQKGIVYALENINLHIKEREICGFIGKSGAGKSTLLHCLNLLEKPTKGEVWVNGQNLVSLSKQELRVARRHIGMIFQHFNLLSSRTVFANVAFPLELIHTDKKVIMSRVNELLQLVGLTDKALAYPHQLSGGQKQRVAIARALATNPKVLLCDEATSALDPQTTQSVLDCLKTINEQLGITIVLITHELSVIKTICDQVVILEKGRLAETTNVFDLFIHPKTEVAKDFIKTYLNRELPVDIMQHFSSEYIEEGYPLLHISFMGEMASQPVLYRLMKELDIPFNILQASIEYIKQRMLGVMLVEILDQQHRMNDLLFFLRQAGLQVEVIGYVSTDHPRYH